MWIICTIGEWKETAGQVGIHPTRISHTNSTPAGAYLCFSPFRAAILCQHPLSSLFPFYKFAMFADVLYFCRVLQGKARSLPPSHEYKSSHTNISYHEEIITFRLVLDRCHGSAGTGVDRSRSAG